MVRSDAGISNAMWLLVLISLIGILSSLIQGTISNWAYDLLRNAGFFPDRPSLKRVLIVLVALLLLVLLVALLDVIPLRILGQASPDDAYVKVLNIWRAKNGTLIGMGVITLSIILLIALRVNLASWISPRLRSRRDKRSIRSLFRSLNSSELQHLYQFIRHKTLTIEFDETDPVVGLLQTKGIIYRPPYALYGEPFRISPSHHQYLTDHPKLFRNVVSKEKA